MMLLSILYCLYVKMKIIGFIPYLVLTISFKLFNDLLCVLKWQQNLAVKMEAKLACFLISLQTYTVKYSTKFTNVMQSNNLIENKAVNIILILDVIVILGKMRETSAGFGGEILGRHRKHHRRQSL